MAPDTVMDNGASKAVSLLYSRIKELYSYPKVAVLRDLIEYLETNNVGREEMLVALTNVNDHGNLLVGNVILSDCNIMVALSIERTQAKTEKYNPIYSFVKSQDGLNFAETYNHPFGEENVGRFKEAVAKQLDLYFEEKQSNLD